MSDKTILIQSDVLGRGNDELGMTLMSNFLRMLVDSRDKPARLVFLNSGVRLVGRGSWAAVHLKKLEAKGIEILACGTCLDFFELKDKMAVGNITSMSKIIELMMQAGTVAL